MRFLRAVWYLIALGRCGRWQVLQETQDREEIIERVAVLDIGKAELTCACGCRKRADRGGGRRWRLIRP
jgi:hypothetical protein